MKRGNTVLVVDGGGRGSALVEKYSQSAQVDRILAVPGNDLMQVNTPKPVKIFPNLKTTDVKEIVDICEKEKVTLVDVAQDNAVAVGLVDALTERGIPALGPTKEAGRIEWDKAWARLFGEKHKLPQPSFKIFNSRKAGHKFIQSQKDQRWFIKASGLAQGKGALPARSSEEALRRIDEMKQFGEAGKVYLIEEWLGGEISPGEEFSTFAVTDGVDFRILGSAQDHKRANNFDEGENTGGMGCSSPPLVLAPAIEKGIAEVIRETISGLNKEGRQYKGILYLGGILVSKGGKLKPHVIEFNARWGDPEAEAILPGLKNDLFELGLAVCEGRVGRVQIKRDSKSRVVVAGVPRGYPSSYDSVKGKQIFGLEKVLGLPGIKLYGAGVKKQGKRYFVAGGRLFYIVGEGKDVIEARRKAYEAMSQVYIEGNNLHYRTDIGWRDVERLT